MIYSLKQAKGSAAPLDPKSLPANAKLFVDIEQRPDSSAAAIQKAIQSGRPLAGLIDPAVIAVIERLSLYQEVSEDLAKLQKSLFDESWAGFLEDLKLVLSGSITGEGLRDAASKFADHFYRDR